MIIPLRDTKMILSAILL